MYKVQVFVLNKVSDHILCEAGALNLLPEQADFIDDDNHEAEWRLEHLLGHVDDRIDGLVVVEGVGAGDQVSRHAGQVLGGRDHASEEEALPGEERLVVETGHLRGVAEDTDRMRGRAG